jgi:methyl-accepting chemotaxis protein-1 (serine sensor receptor)
MSIGARLGVAFAAMVPIVLAIAALSLQSTGAGNNRFESYVDGIGARAALASQLRTAVDVRAISARAPGSRRPACSPPARSPCRVARRSARS